MAALLCMAAIQVQAEPAGQAADTAALDAKLAARGYARGPAVDSVPNYQVDGWHSIDRRHLILSAGASRDYLLTLISDCWDLTTREDIGFTTTATRLTNHDALKLQAPGGGAPSTCPITTIEQLVKVAKPK